MINLPFIITYYLDSHLDITLHDLKNQNLIEMVVIFGSENLAIWKIMANTRIYLWALKQNKNIIINVSGFLIISLIYL